MNFLRKLAAIAALQALGSCSMIYQVKAFFLDGQLAFVNDDVGLDSRWCELYRFKLLDGEGRGVWSFQGTGQTYDRRCRDGSPLFYGRTPSGAEIDKPAEPLRTGTIYVIDGSAAGELEGAFTLYRGGGKLVIRNLPTDSDEVRAIRNDSEWRNRKARAVTE